jgi:hypothetical protein
MKSEEIDGKRCLLVREQFTPEETGRGRFTAVLVGKA